jgi:hypothetical protein
LKYVIIRDFQTMVWGRKRWWKSNIWMGLFSFENRSNVFYQWLMNLKRINFRMSYLNECINVWSMIIYGFQSSLVYLRINWHVLNDAVAVLFYYMFRCYWIFTSFYNR